MSKVTVVGSGVMGKGIAYAFAISGYKVHVHDINHAILESAKKEIHALLGGSFEKGFLTEEIYQSAKDNLVFEPDLQTAAAGAELVVEAVLERMDVKLEVFKQLDQICPPETVLATNTSTMSPTEIGAQTSRPEKVIAMHFFNPVHKMKLIEVIRGLETSEETVNFIHKTAAKINKKTVEVNEFPGFVTSRMNCLIGNEAMNLLMEGVASAKDIDHAMKLGLNHPMGPLELADLVGLDTRLRNMEYLHAALGEKYRPCPLLVKYVKAGRLGKKSGRGFYEYN
ncbi:3-hydroxyacyl-CoA dehydrogenase family protein [Oceanobacillus sp. J11TS1]|uniref:3-hydroxyacyl-CoA dehydrogenase family protein n=1 Tax=Oceanobacillus sp. J11TS1 TaxID=2807191 RepID=UPI001B1AC64D|nr:3-hydroxyacyl-CoA dehydrogenase NAD-binding domain-containing protein [Oceanobacillus sp. J11TS1]GIO24146.1 putative 3-hydroxybutyryl-CoA dehydrogenase [Oceanobacillus sp. J11TS1]